MEEAGIGEVDKEGYAREKWQRIPKSVDREPRWPVVLALLASVDCMLHCLPPWSAGRAGSFRHWCWYCLGLQ